MAEGPDTKLATPMNKPIGAEPIIPLKKPSGFDHVHSFGRLLWDDYLFCLSEENCPVIKACLVLSSSSELWLGGVEMTFKKSL